MIYVQDGILNDTDKALQAVLDSSNLPLSIVIVGIGPADFTAMVTIHIYIRFKYFKTFTTVSAYYNFQKSRHLKIASMRWHLDEIDQLKVSNLFT